MKLHAFVTRLFRAVRMTRLHPANVTWTKAALITDAHFTAGNHINGVMGVPMQTGMEVRRKIGLDQKRLAGPEDTSRRGRPPVGIVKGLPTQILGTDVRSHIAASLASRATKDC